MRTRIKGNFNKLGVLCLALVVGLGGMGVGLAHWQDTLTISGTVNTGVWDLGGTPGFWKNWDSHNTYTQQEIEGWLGGSSWFSPTSVEDMEDICYDGEGGTAEEKFLRAYLATRLDVASGRLNGTTIHNFSGISGYSYLGLATPLSATLTDIIAAIEGKYPEPDQDPPTDDEFEIMKNICDALNNLGI